MDKRVRKVKGEQHLNPKGNSVIPEFRRGIEHDREGRHAEDREIDDEHGSAYDRLLIRAKSACYSTRKGRHR